MSNLTITANASLPQESETDTFQTRQSSAISEHSSVKGSPQAIRAWLTSLPPASRASLSAPPESEPEPTTPAICGQQPSNASAWYDRASHSWRTFQVSFLAVTLEPFSETWPRAGMMHAGAFYPQPSWEHRISAIDYGLLLPTQRAAVLATPQARDFRTGSTARWEEARKGLKSCNLNDQIGGQLNPTWVEWLMGWPLGWTDCAAPATAKYQEWRQWHGVF